MTWDLSQSPRHTGVEQTGKEAGFAIWDSEHPWETHRGQWQRSEGPFDQPLSHAPPAGRSAAPPGAEPVAAWEPAGAAGTEQGKATATRAPGFGRPGWTKTAPHLTRGALPSKAQRLPRAGSPENVPDPRQQVSRSPPPACVCLGRWLRGLRTGKACVGGVTQDRASGRMLASLKAAPTLITKCF